MTTDNTISRFRSSPGRIVALIIASLLPGGCTRHRRSATGRGRARLTIDVDEDVSIKELMWTTGWTHVPIAVAPIPVSVSFQLGVRVNGEVRAQAPLRLIVEGRGHVAVTLGLTEVEQHRPGRVQQGEHPPRAVVGDEVEIGHAAPEQRVSGAGVVANVQTRHPRGVALARLVHQQQLGHALAQGRRSLVAASECRDVRK